MKIQLDTDNKTIKVEQDVLLSKLVETLDKLLPNKEWKKFTLKTNTIIEHWSSPIYIERYHSPVYPWWGATYAVNNLSSKQNAMYSAKDTSANLSSLSLKSGVFNVEA